ncbi:MAG: cysteine synthase CysM [Salinisphaera sp.]|nr:cysteine synthase CysM [Salinisphaera sp.]
MHASLPKVAKLADMNFPGLESFVGGTPLVRLQRLVADSASRRGNVVLVKLEGNNPAGSVKDRPAYSMIRYAAERGDIRPGDTLIEATSGNTGIALAMVSAMQGYRLRLLMPENMSEERRAVMRAFGADLVSVSQKDGMEGARDLADEMGQRGDGYVLNQFANADNPRAHYEGTGPEIWSATGGAVTHFVSAMGTTGTIMGVSRYLKEQSPSVRVVGVQPAGESKIPGIRRWPAEYLPSIFEPERVDRVIDVEAQDAEDTMRALASREGVFAGPSSGGAVCAALQLADEVENAVIVAIICDRGDRYLSTGVYA